MNIFGNNCSLQTVLKIKAKILHQNMASCPCLFSFTCMVTCNNSSRIICSLMAFELPESDDEWPESGHGDTWHCPRAGASSPLIVTPAMVNQENQHLFVKYLGWEIPPPAIRFRRLPRILAPAPQQFATSHFCTDLATSPPRYSACVMVISIPKPRSIEMISSSGCFVLLTITFLCFQTRHT